MEVLFGMDLPAVLVLLPLAGLLFYIYGIWPYAVWKSLGVDGPAPSPFFGHQYQIAKKGTEQCFEKWSETYGRTFGIYAGRRPVLVTSDLEILKTVLVKDFNLFPDRYDNLEVNPPEVQSMMPFAKGAQWKKLRHLLTPTFSTGKLKQMDPYFQRCSTHLAKNIEEAARRGERIDVKKYFGAFTLDVIANTAFGIQLSSQDDFSEPFIRDAAILFDDIAKYSGPLNLISTAFPSLMPIVKFLATNVFKPKGWTSFVANVQRVIEERKREGKREGKVDFLEMVLSHEETEGSTGENLNTLTRTEVIGQVLIFFIAGYETTASTLQFMSYCLALHPEVQEKIVREIEEQLGDDAPTYESTSKLKYLDSTISETLRMFPPANGVNRMASEDVTINGVTIPKGAGVWVPVNNILKDPVYFPEPEKFRPERFSESKVDPISFLPFGFGPRQCIGMRLALMEAKIAMVHVLRRVEFIKTDDLPEHLVIKPGSLLNVPERVIEVKAVPRNVHLEAALVGSYATTQPSRTLYTGRLC